MGHGKQGGARSALQSAATQGDSGELNWSQGGSHVPFCSLHCPHAQAFMEAIGDDLIDSIVGDQIPIYTEQEKYNLTVESTVERVNAKLRGQPVPGGLRRCERAPG